ncbi:MAG TPA: hypothetical protein VGZ27_19260 [Vicinamibacterales bacterium]|jgi:hypothetical protein|nr:hypothetical protein [Vicinamibacterales bacterium]
MSDDKTLGALVLEMWELRAAMQASGTTDPEALDAGIEGVLRGRWPFVRAWHYVCDTCSDVGLRISECPGDDTCGRTKPHAQHSFGKPCFCKAGAAFREKPTPAPEDRKKAGKSKPMVRIGGPRRQAKP